VLLAPSAAYVRPTASRIPQYVRLRSKIPRNLAVSRLSAKPSRFDAFVAENDKALKDVGAFWAKKAKDSLHWSKPFASALENGFGSGEISWFKDGELNVCYNCLDRHLPHLAHKPAIVFEGDLPEDTQTVTYGELHEQVCRLANLMVQHGVQKGDVVTTYMPTSPELVAVMLACARIGAVHK
jgi:acetyl-CoA synthetase